MLDIHLDPLGGIAGDMFAAAILDLRPDLQEGLGRALASCPLLDHVEVELVAHNDGILTGKRFIVRRYGCQAEDDVAGHHHHHAHAHAHEHEHHHHHHDDDHDHSDHHHEHADWRLIREALAASDLDAEAVRHAIGIFTLLAAAEAKVHGVAPEDVRFHEVGAWDSIADIVAAGWLIARLGAARWTVGSLPLGGGRVRTAHGLLPVPAPATALLLQGFQTIDDGIGGERVTPTGAAIVSYLCRSAEASVGPRRLTGSAHGFGTKRLPGVSNCLRLLAFETNETTVLTASRVAVLECEIDDQTSEDLAQAIETLRAGKGVLDVVQAPVFGKKGRMMTHLRVLAEEHAQDEVAAMIFEETTTIGLRRSIVQRSVLRREASTIESDGRTLRLKIVERPSGRTAKVEADDLADVAGNGARNDLRRAAETLFDSGKDS